MVMLLLPVRLAAQDGMIAVRYSTDNGLPSNTVYSTLKDRDGFIWLGTWYGLSSFDGTEFTPYVTRRNAGHDIPPRKVISIVEDKHDNLWIRTTDNRFFRFDKTTSRFTDMYPQLRRVAQNLRVIKVQPLDNGNSLIYTRDKSLFEVYTDKENKPVIKPIYHSKNDIDRGTMRLKRNVIGETDRFIYWLGPNFQVEVASKGQQLAGKRLLGNINSLKASCFYRYGDVAVVGYENGRATTINLKTGKTATVSIGVGERINTATIVGGRLLLSTDRAIFDTKGNALASTGVRAETAFADKYGMLWLYGLDCGLTLFNPATKTVSHFPTPRQSVLDAVKFCDTGANGLFILLRNGKVWKYDRQRHSMDDISSILTQTAASTDFDGGITPTAIGTQITVSPFLKEKSQASSFSDIDIDSDGLLWLSSTNNGLFKVRFPRKQFSFLMPELLSADTDASDNNYGIRSLYQTRNGNLWIGTRRGNLYCVDMKTGGCISKFKGDFGNVYNIMEDRKGNLWLSSKGSGLIKGRPDRSMPNGYRFTTYRHDSNDRYSLSNDKVYYTFEDSKGRIWVCTYGGGLNLMALRNGKTVFINKNNELKNYPPNDLYMNVRQIAEDNSHTMWVATTDGLLSFSGNFKKSAEIRFNNFRQNDNPTVVDNDIFSILKDCHGNIWISIFGCSLNKVGSYDETTGKLQLETIHDNGVQGNIVSTAVEDKKHRLWLTTENGLASLNDRTESVRSFGFLDGFLRSKVEDNTAFCLNDGRILIGSREGIIVFNPDDVEREANRSYKTFIVDFKVQNRSMDSFDPPISEVLPRYAKEITLNHDQNMFSIEFATIKFIGNNRTAFKYILDGYEDQWHMNDNSRVASYANVPPGHYTFRVKPVDSNSPECTLRITVLPPWWATWWAYTIYLILLGAAVYAGTRLALYMIRMRNEVYINDRLAELKIRFFTNVSHELRTPLTLIKSPIAELGNREKLSREGREYLKLIDRSATKMLHLVNQILDFRKVQNGKMKMNVHNVNINAIAEAIAGEYRLAAMERDINLCLRVPEEPVMAWCDAEKIGVIVNNLVNNAFKYTDKNGYIGICVSHNDAEDSFSITVEDDGATIPEKQLDSIFERFSMADNAVTADSQHSGTGIGLSLAREFAVMHHGKIGARNRTEGKGVAFTLEIPMGKEKFNGDNVEFLLDDNTKEATVPTDTEWSDFVNDSETAESTDNGDRPTLVLVEDNADMRRMLELQLTHRYNVVSAEDGAEGLEIIKEIHPDLIITDLMMPRMDGMELLRRIRQDFNVSHVPVIVLTAKNSDEDRLRTIASGANAYITKPFSNEMLTARITQLIKEQSVFQRKMVLQAKPATDSIAERNDGYEQHLVKKDIEFIERIHSVIEENLNNEDFNIDTIAGNIGLSRSAFFKKLKSMTGLAPVDLVREIRLGKAEELVATTDMSIAEIAYAVGFRESSYFGKCFKKKYGMTPMEYRSEKKETAKGKDKNTD